MKCGVEIEFASPLNNHDLVAKAQAANFYLMVSSSNNDWAYDYLGTDDSPSIKLGDFGLEFKSRTFNLEDGIPPNIFRLLKFFEEAGCYVTKTCGIHFHLSQDESFHPAFLRRLRQELLDKYHPDPKRKQWIDRNIGKYRRLNEITEKHVEVRAFNSSLQCRALGAYYRLLLKLVRPIAVGEATPVVCDNTAPSLTGSSNRFHASVNSGTIINTWRVDSDSSTAVATGAVNPSSTYLSVSVNRDYTIWSNTYTEEIQCIG